MKSKKRILYILLGLNIISLFISGLILKFSVHDHRGFRHSEIDAGIFRHFVCNMHFIASITFMILLAIHVWMNWKVIKKMLKA